MVSLSSKFRVTRWPIHSSISNDPQKRGKNTWGQSREGGMIEEGPQKPGSWSRTVCSVVLEQKRVASGYQRCWQ